ncbi:MAG: hypothetical protein IJ300_04370 [Clostridia bacterium]|nr:hypothetical protein [Clostridia bacterium]
MKKIISVISALVVMFVAISVSAQNDGNFLVMPSEQTIESFTYYSNAMRILDEYSGFRYIVEFDVNFPSSDGASSSYSLDFNHTTTDTGTSGVSHNSAMTVTNDTWKWTAAGKNVVENLACGTDYHIKIAVDLKEQKQYCSVSDVSEGTVLGYLHGEPIHQAISSDAHARISQNLRWGGAWVDKDNETWGSVQPTNVKLKRNSAYVLEQPVITFGDGNVSAKVMSYHNTADSVKSPVLMLCVYDTVGTLVCVSAAQAAYEANTTSKPVAKELIVSKDVELTTGMTATAMVISGFAARQPFVPATTAIYSE